MVCGKLCSRAACKPRSGLTTAHQDELQLLTLSVSKRQAEERKRNEWGLAWGLQRWSRVWCWGVQASWYMLQAKCYSRDMCSRAEPWRNSLYGA